MDSLYSDSSRSRAEDVSSTEEYVNSNGSVQHRYDDDNTTLTTSHLHSRITNNNTNTNGYDNNDDEEEEEITPAELIEQLQHAWLNEKFSPELLDHKTAVVECIIEQIKHMESNISSAKKGDFRIAIHKLEVWFVLLWSFLEWSWITFPLFFFKS